MNAIHIRKKLDSETVYLPELRSLVGKTVDIFVQEERAGSDVAPGAGDWDAAMNAVSELEDYDFNAYQRQREYDLQKAKVHLP